MLMKTLLNKVENFKSFVYKGVHLEVISGAEALVVNIQPRKCQTGMFGLREEISWV